MAQGIILALCVCFDCICPLGDEIVPSEIKLYNMDCMEAMVKMPDKAFDLCITDPPYGIGLEYGVYKDTEKNWFDLMDRFIPEIKRVSNMAIFPCCRIKALPYFYTKFTPDWLICWHKGSPGHSAYVGFNDVVRLSNHFWEVELLPSPVTTWGLI